MLPFECQDQRAAANSRGGSRFLHQAVSDLGEEGAGHRCSYRGWPAPTHVLDAARDLEEPGDAQGTVGTGGDPVKILGVGYLALLFTA